MNRLFFIRADGNTKIGIGHIMRCMTIADELVRLVKRSEVVFVCADEASARVVRDRDFDVRVLGTDYTDMESELLEFRDILSEYEAYDIRFLLDSYYVTNKYIESLRKFGKVAMLDDLQEQSFPADIIINYNIYANKAKYEELYGDKGSFYIGAKYAPLRPQFMDTTYQVKDRVENVLITMGGADYMNIAGKVYEVLGGLDSSIKYHLISGVYSPFFEELKEKEEKNDNLTVYHDVVDMASVMKKCDVAITAGGSTVYELSSIGVPLICISYADNQLQNAEYIGENISDYVGAYDKAMDDTVSRLVSVFTEKYMSREYREECYKKEKGLVDGKGAARIAQVLMND